MASKIEDYALLGDCETAALVSRDGSIDWLCWPRFDSSACFAALLGGPEHGRWLIRPSDPAARAVRSYREDTLILETNFETGDGAVSLIDFMQPRGDHSHVFRIVVGRSGQVAMHIELKARSSSSASRSQEWARLSNFVMTSSVGAERACSRHSFACSLHSWGLPYMPQEPGHPCSSDKKKPGQALRGLLPVSLRGVAREPMVGKGEMPTTVRYVEVATTLSSRPTRRSPARSQPGFHSLCDAALGSGRAL